MNISRKSILTLLKDYLIITFACFLFAFAWECFMIPRGLSAGGMMGFCTVLQYATDGLIQTQYSYFVINALLIILAVLAMGIGFGFKTIYCIVSPRWLWGFCRTVLLSTALKANSSMSVRIC